VKPRKMKDSGIPWIGEIPEGWTVRKLRFLGRLDSNGVDKKIREGEPQFKSVHYMDVYKNALNEIGDSDNYLVVSAPEEKAEACALSQGDVLFTNSSETPDDIGHSTVVRQDLERTLFGYHLMRFRSYEKMALRFEKYLFGSQYLKSWFASRATGITRYSITYQDFAEALIPVPSVPEQERIAAYLDGKCGEIDRVIAAKERQNGLLRDQRAAVIHETVTKGLNPKAKFKESGYEWIGRVPKDWRVLKLRYVGSCQNGISKSGDLFGSGFPFVSYGDVYQNEVLPESVAGLVESTPEDQENYSVRDGDVFFTRTSETIEEIGLTSVCMKTIEKATFAGFLIRFRPYVGMLDKAFSKYYFRSIMHRGFFVKEMNIVTRASLGQDLLKKLPVLIPALPEQQQIAAHLDSRCGEIDRVMAANAGMVAKLKEYRASLIWEAVTGKKCL